ncbi:adenylate/guanylate cyclase domain-containing protein [Shimia biformata]|uniref:adenylate/guanylate cyclase domain-containing protein n=1 Tax=Shimia biformata TaxID=1294299 RepID=UPI00194F3CA6|nr:adenylate/guanylate cyclase domain-containing protein [Shimia biformata]
MTGVRPSPELLAVARRWIDAIPNHRPNDLRNLMTEEGHLQFVGTADDELWTGQQVREGVAAFFDVIPELLKHEETFAEAYEHEGTGWACLNHQLIFANQPGRLFNVRTTLIFVLEDGAWKIVHRHGSVPIPNIEMTGTEQTAIADLVAAARSGLSFDQHEGFASVMFTDIVNSSGMAAVMGDRLWSSEVTRHFAQLRDKIEANGGQFVKSLGDGTMSSFASPADALSAARAILRALNTPGGPAIALRIGVHTGDVICSDDDFFGSVVNKAARITDTAEPGQIRVSGATQAMLSDRSEISFAGPMILALKGFENPEPVYVVTEA